MKYPEILLKDDYASDIEDTKLFYPCSCNDYLKPIEIFAPIVTEFIFVDIGYLREGETPNKSNRLSLDARFIKPILNEELGYEFLDSKIIGNPNYPYSQPLKELDTCILIQRFKNLDSNKLITIKIVRGFGYDCFEKLALNQLGVFFYRGDSQDVSGSKNYWFNRSKMLKVCDKLIDGGLVVTDGSNYDRRSMEYFPFASHKHNEYYVQTGEHSLQLQFDLSMKKRFVDKYGNIFTCFGYIGIRCGQTFVWKLNKDYNYNNHPYLSGLLYPKINNKIRKCFK